MKKAFILSIVSILTLGAVAQEKEKEEEKHSFFRKDKLFTGGDFNLAFSNNVTTIGLSPVFGHSFTSYLDAGLSLNFTYTSYRYSEENKARLTVLGPGVFVRAYPVNFLFIQAQYDHYFVKYKELYSGTTINKITYGANSALLGAGYCSGREDEDSPFYYLGVFIDVGGDEKSPNLGTYGQIIPIFKAGLQVPLFRGK